MMEDNNYFQSIKSIPKDLKFDAILVLGGGVPEDISNPPSYTKERCKLASSIYSSSKPKPKILTLSAGTAHLPQALSADGLPIWEATASAAYLIKHLNVKPSDVFAETTSYDTISNAFFARLNFCDIAKWNKLLIITNEFHMERARLIFDWIFHAPTSDADCNSTVTSKNYELYYLPAPDKGLTAEAIQARREKESKSASTVKNVLSQTYTSIEEIFEFLTSEHSFYTASKLVERGMEDGSDNNAVGKLVQDSYGGASIQRKVIGEGKSTSSSLTFLNGFLFGIGLTILIIMFGKRTIPNTRGKRHHY
jgi:vancomycin permeability regulator SanA